MATTKTAADIANELNAIGYEYYGETAKAWSGNGFCRIYFGADFVTIKNGQVSNSKAGKSRAVTIGESAVEAVLSVI